MEKDERQKTTPEVNDSTPSAGPATFENVPDPDEDDLDDLDGIQAVLVSSLISILSNLQTCLMSSRLPKSIYPKMPPRK